MQEKASLTVGLGGHHLGPGSDGRCRQWVGDRKEGTGRSPQAPQRAPSFFPGQPCPLRVLSCTSRVDREGGVGWAPWMRSGPLGCRLRGVRSVGLWAPLVGGGRSPTAPPRSIFLPEPLRGRHGARALAEVGSRPSLNAGPGVGQVPRRDWLNEEEGTRQQPSGSRSALAEGAADGPPHLGMPWRSAQYVGSGPAASGGLDGTVPQMRVCAWWGRAHGDGVGG